MRFPAVMRVHRPLGRAGARWLVGGLLLSAAASRLFAADAAMLAGALESITSADLKGYVDVLAADMFEGREAGSRGGQATGAYLSQALRSMGVRPAGEGGSYFQPFGSGYRNLLCMIEGSDAALRNEWILVSAHYDHVGYGTPNNSYGPFGRIHNGADDNASGTAAVLELVSALSSLPRPPRRPILFAFWDGEEKGLLGSRHWAADPTVPLEQVRMVMNLDMVGRLRKDRLEIGGTRTSWGLRGLLSEANWQNDLRLDFTWKLDDNSDHWPFFERNIPVLLVHTGLHEDYHRPSDDSHLVDSVGMQRVVRYLTQSIVMLAEADELGRFRSASRREIVAEQRRDRPRFARAPSRLGVRWDTQASPLPGARVVHVAEGSAAEKSQLRPGDVIVAVDGRPLQAADELRSAVLGAAEPIELAVFRGEAADSEFVELTVALTGQPVRVGISWKTDPAEPGSVILTRVVADSPAARAGLWPGDRIDQINGQDFADSDEFQRRLEQHAGPLTLRAEREGRLNVMELVLPAR